ncbi:MAG: hypothetical protein N3G18_04690 [Candidatus Saccharicenans sp.]|nr:hypothetical protein [Candidatus Saccharicenans sp.]
MKKILATVLPLLVLILLVADCARKTESQGEKEVASATSPGTATSTNYDSLYTSMLASLQGKDYKKALEAVEAIKDRIWEEAPLALKNVVLVKGMNNTYGVYEPEDNDVYSRGETIYVYLEPAGYKIVKNEAGYYEFRFTADFQLVNENGDILGGQEQFANLPFKSWHPNKEVAITFNYNFSGLPAGKYKVVTTVHDANSERRVSADTWFTIE